MRNIFILLLIATPLLLANDVSAQSLVRHYHGNPIKWNKEKINICLDQNTYKIKNIEEYLNLSIKTWSIVDKIPKLQFSSELCDVNVYYQLDTDKYDIAPLGTNTIKFSGSGIIYSGEININNYYSSQLGDAKVNSRMYDIPSILSHEIGHILGLNEDMVSPNTVMYITTPRGTTHKRSLSEKDINNITQLYN